MKNKSLIGLLALSAFGISSVAFGQTCATPIVVTQGGSGSGNTCTAPTGTGANTIGQYCGVVGSPENEIIYTVHLGAAASGATFDVTGVGAGFNPALVLFQAADATACLVASNCIGLPADSAGNGGNESLSLPGPAGDYYIAVTGSPGSGTCGAFSWASAGTLPVKLTGFSVQ